MRLGIPYYRAAFHSWFVLLGLCASLAVPSQAAAGEGKPITVAQIDRTSAVDFEKEVLPILSTSCLACHNKTKAKAKLVLETPADIRKGGESGPAAIGGKAMESLLLKAAAHTADVDSPMPPPHNPANAPDLTSDQLGLIRLWIDQGANGEVHGSTNAVKWVALAPVVQPIYAVAVSGDGQYAACGRGNHIDIYNLSTGHVAAHLVDPGIARSTPNAAHHDLVESLAFSPDGMVLASGSYREIKLWRRPMPEKKSEWAGLGTSIQCTAVSPDGKLMAVCDEDGTVRLFETDTGKPAGELVGHIAPVTALSFSPDGDRLASVSVDMTARVWNVKNCTMVCKVDSPCELRAVAWVSGGKGIAVGGADGIIRIWNLPESQNLDPIQFCELGGHEGSINTFATDPSNDTLLISGGEDGVVRLWDTKSSHLVKEAKHGAAICAVAMRKDGKRFASAGLDNTVRLWNTADGKQIAESRGDPALEDRSIKAGRSLSLAINEIAYCKARMGEADKEKAAQATRLTAAKSALVATEKDFQTRQHALEDATVLRKAADTQLTARKRSADAVARAEEAFKSIQESLAQEKRAEGDKSRDQTELAAASDAVGKAKNALSAMKLDDKKKAADAAVVKATAELAKITAARTIANQEVKSSKQSVEAAETALALRVATLKAAEAFRAQRESELDSAKKQFAASAKPNHGLAFSPDGATLAAADDELVRTLYSENGALGDSIRGAHSTAGSIAFIGSDSLIAVDQKTGSATTWDLSSRWTLERTIGSADGSSAIADRVTSLDFSPDGKTLASGGGIPSRGGEIKLWEPGTGRLVRSFDEVHIDSVTSVRFSPDGRRLASGSTDRFVRIIDLSTGKVAFSLEGHQHHVLGVAWRSNGHTIASAGADNTLRFWNADSGEKDNVVPGFDKEVTSVCFIGDSDQALVSSGDGRVTAFHDNGVEQRSYPSPTEFIYATACSPDGKTIVAGGEDGVLRVWNAITGQVIATFNP